MKNEEIEDKNELLKDVEEEQNKNEGFSIKDTAANIFFSMWHIFLTLTLFAALVYLFFIMSEGNNVKLLVSDKEMIKSFTDRRRYRAIKLQNNLNVVLVYDESNIKSGVSLTIGAGSFQDPASIHGLAHLTEKLIFSGRSQDYNEPNQLQDHLSAHHGSTNSFTEEEKTTFYFELNQEGFDLAIHMLSRMIAKPLIKPESISSYLNTIQNEINWTIDQDQWREHQLIKALANPAHPFSGFSLGDIKQLKKLDPNYLTEQIKAFYNKYYNSSNMKLVISSSMNIELLEDLVSNYFSDIQLDRLDEKGNNQYGYNIINNNATKAFTQDQLGHIAWYQNKPINSTPKFTPTIDFVFILDEVVSMSKRNVKPLDYITYILKYSGAGSLIDNLKTKNFAVKVDIGVIASFKTFSQFAISIYLTKGGLDYCESIIELTFGYINKIKSNSDILVGNSYYDELRTISDNNFNYLSKESSMSDVLTSISNNMLDYENAANEYIRNENVYKTFNNTMISEYFNSLTIQNVIIIIGSNSLNDNFKNLVVSKSNDPVVYNKEMNFDFLYLNKKIEVEMINKLSNIKMGMEINTRPVTGNKFISRDLKLESCYGSGNTSEIKNFMQMNRFNESISKKCDVENSEITPKLVRSTQRLKIWYRLDRSFIIPRVVVNLNIISRESRDDKLKFTNLNIFFEYVKLMVDRNLNEAIDAGNEISLQINENGILITITAYNTIVKKIIDQLVIYILDYHNLKTSISLEVYTELLTAFGERKFIQSDNNKIKQFFNQIVKKGAISTSNEEIFKEISYESFLNAISAIQNNFYINLFIYGNINENGYKIIESAFDFYLLPKELKDPYYNLEEFKLIDSQHSHNILDGSFVYKNFGKLNETINNSNKNYLSNYHQIGFRSAQNSLMMDLVKLVWGNIFNYQLKIVKKVGNVLQADVQIIDSTMYFVFALESITKSPEELNNELDKVLSLLFDRLDKMNIDKFESYKEVLIRRLKLPFNNLKEKSQAAWTEVYEDTLDFELMKNMKLALTQITLKDVILFFGKNFVGGPKKLSIRVYNKETSDVNSYSTSKEENYGYLNTKLKSIIYTTTDFLSAAKLVTKRINTRRNNKNNSIKNNKHYII